MAEPAKIQPEEYWTGICVQRARVLPDGKLAGMEMRANFLVPPGAGRYVHGATVALAIHAPALREALKKIAAYDDEGANQHLERTGSYGRFDEPGAVQVARAALTAWYEVAREESGAGGERG